MGKIAFIFPGQGSQQVGMGQEMASTYKKAQDTFYEADEALGVQLSSLCFKGPKENLQLTTNTQPALLTTSIACLRVFEDAKLKPDYVAGHSLGEYSALVAAGSVQFNDAVKVVHKRGRFMEEAVPSGIGSMAAILNMDRDIVKEVCEFVSNSHRIVEPANYNCPGQIVISGHKEAVQEAGELARERGARKVIPLPVSGPFHSSLMKNAANQLENALEEIVFKDANVPVIANMSGKSVLKRKEIVASLIKQVYQPVMWEDSIRYLLDQGVDTFIEIGVGEVLSRLVKKTERRVNVLSVQDPQSLEDTVRKLGEINCVRE